MLELMAQANNPVRVPRENVFFSEPSGVREPNPHGRARRHGVAPSGSATDLAQHEILVVEGGLDPVLLCAALALW